MDDLHSLSQKAKAFFNENGRAPTWNEFHGVGVSYYLMKKFGFVNILNAAGLPVPPQFKKKFHPPANVMHVDLKKQLEEYKPHEIFSRPNWPRIVCIPDAHFPFVSQYALERIYRFIEIFQPEYVVHQGDLYDFLCHSKYPRSQNTWTPEQEEILGREMAVEMWREIQKAAPKATCHQLIGNHDVRPLKRTLESLPTQEHWAKRQLKELLTFENVITQDDPRVELEIAGILFTHGFLGKEGAHRDYLMQSVVIGHLHKLWVQMRRLRGEQIFELCTGMIGDPESKALGYTPSKRGNYQIGFGVIDEYGPRTIHI